MVSSTPPDPSPSCVRDPNPTGLRLIFVSTTLFRTDRPSSLRDFPFRLLPFVTCHNCTDNFPFSQDVHLTCVSNPQTLIHCDSFYLSESYKILIPYTLPPSLRLEVRILLHTISDFTKGASFLILSVLLGSVGTNSFIPMNDGPDPFLHHRPKVLVPVFKSIIIMSSACNLQSLQRDLVKRL